MSIPDNILCLEFVTHTNDDPLVSRVFVVDRFVGAQAMTNERARWEVRDMGTAEQASEYLVHRIAELERDASLHITVEPGTVALYESEFNGLHGGCVIPPSLRVRIRQRIRREHKRS